MRLRAGAKCHALELGGAASAVAANVAARRLTTRDQDLMWSIQPRPSKVRSRTIAVTWFRTNARHVCCRAQKRDPGGLASTSRRGGSSAGIRVGGGASVPISGVGLCGNFQARALLIAENLCLRQQLLVLQCRHPGPRLRNADRRFWIVASRRLGGWRNSLLIVKPEAVLSWQRLGWDVAIFSPGEGRSPGDRGGTSGSRQAHVHGKCSVGSKTDSSRVGKVGVQGFRQNRGKAPGITGAQASVSESS
jgi:hypothetical protein